MQKNNNTEFAKYIINENPNILNDKSIDYIDFWDAMNYRDGYTMKTWAEKNNNTELIEYIEIIEEKCNPQKKLFEILERE